MEGSSFSSFSSSSSSSDLEAGFSGSGPYFLHPSSYSTTNSNSNRRRRGSYRAVAGSSPRARFFCDPLSDDEPHHFLDSCFLCKKPLAGNRDIFMYRGDTPFCNEECRQEQIEMDEAKEKNWKHSLKASREKRSRRRTRRPTPRALPRPRRSTSGLAPSSPANPFDATKASRPNLIQYKKTKKEQERTVGGWGTEEGGGFATEAVGERRKGGERLR